ncbi:MAG: hypothetical protein IKV59_06940 [Lachnospiraceae bacterium]|nr:hypothetical protein [Lachnospiraceae bacterium]
MIFLKRLYLRAVRYKKQNGGITVWLALSFLVFLGLYQVCLQSVWKQSQRQQAEQAAEAGIFSLLSEYEPHLLEDYDLFYVDTSFRSGIEKQDELCSHLWKFIDMNLKNSLEQPMYGLQLEGVNVTDLVRATDGNGMAFYQQAVRIMKEKRGVSLAEDWLSLESWRKDADEKAEKYERHCERYKGSVVNYEAEEEEEEPEEEAFTWDGLWENFTFSMAIPYDRILSKKEVFLDTAPSHRTLSIGSGSTKTVGMLDRQWFISYLCEYLTHAQEMLEQERETGYLDYQLEYIISGENSDSGNLEKVIRKLLLMREGINYTFLLSHPDYEDKAEVLAYLLAGLTGNKVLIKSVKHLILLGWAYGESLAEIRQLLGGYDLAMIKTEDHWQVSLSGLLTMIGNPGKYDVQVKKQEGMDYEDCMRIFLMLQSEQELAMRALDIIEGELQCKKGCENIHLDHCVEALTAQLWMNGIYLERSAGYE